MYTVIVSTVWRIHRDLDFYLELFAETKLDINTIKNGKILNSLSNSIQLLFL